MIISVKRNFLELKDINELIKKDKPEIKESPYVAGNLDIVASIIDKIHTDLKKMYVKGQGERAWPTVVALAKMAGYKVSKEKQAKGKMYRYDIKK